MKVLRVLLNKFFLSALLFLSQLFLIGVFLTALHVYYWAFQVFWGLISVVLFFVIFSRKETPEYKIPWIFLIMVFPLFGTLLFALYAHPKMKPKDRKTLAAIEEGVHPFIETKTTEELDEIKRFLGEYDRLETCLQKSGRLYGDLSTRVTYFALGEDCWKDMLCELEKAKSFIFMEFFIIAPGKMWDTAHELLLRKLKEGVEVRILYDDIGSARRTPSRFYKDLQKEGFLCYKFNKFRPIITSVFNNRDHRKIVVIDGKVGYTGGLNIGDEYINEYSRLGHWKDTAVKLEGPAVKNLTDLFLYGYDITTKKLSDYQKYLSVPVDPIPQSGYVHPFGDGPKPYYEEQVGKFNFLNLLGIAKKYAWITTPYLIMDFSLIDALRNAAMRGVDVRIFTPHVPDKKAVFALTRSNYAFLISAGVKIYEYTPGFLHAKMMLVDDCAAFVGTINMDYRSLTHHYECGVVLYDTPCLADIHADFENMTAVSEEITLERAKKIGGYRPAKMLLSVFAPFF